MTNTRDFLLQYVDRPMVWGVDDCSLMIADWWLANHGKDPARHLRGTYSTEAEKVAVVEAAGGLLPLVASLAAMWGAIPSHDATEGDFAVIEVAGRVTLCGIRAGNFWAVRSAQGVAFTQSAKVVRAWHI